MDESNREKAAKSRVKKVLQKLSIDQLLVYRIEVQGRVDERRAGRFQTMTVTIGYVGGIVPIPIVTRLLERPSVFPPDSIPPQDRVEPR